MSVADSDLELLEAYLDDELSHASADELRERLARDAELAEALEQLHQQRELRVAVWRAMEPEQKASDQFAWRLRGLLRRDARWGRSMQSLRVAGAAAACLLIGIIVGRSADVPGPAGDDGAVSPYVWSSSPVSDQGPQAQQGLYRVSLTDNGGRVIAVQPFGTLAEAREFAHDVGQWQAKHREVRSGNVRLVADEF